MLRKRPFRLLCRSMQENEPSPAWATGCAEVFTTSSFGSRISPALSTASGGSSSPSATRRARTGKQAVAGTFGETYIVVEQSPALTADVHDRCRPGLEPAPRLSCR